MVPENLFRCTPWDENRFPLAVSDEPIHTSTPSVMATPAAPAGSTRRPRAFRRNPTRDGIAGIASRTVAKPTPACPVGPSRTKGFETTGGATRRVPPTGGAAIQRAVEVDVPGAVSPVGPGDVDGSPLQRDLRRVGAAAPAPGGLGTSIEEGHSSAGTRRSEDRCRWTFPECSYVPSWTIQGERLTPGVLRFALPLAPP